MSNQLKRHFIKSNLRDSSTKPKSVRSKPSQRPSHSQHSKQKAKSKSRPNSKSSVEAPIRLTKRPKPIYRWVPKVQAPTSSNNPVTTSFNLHDKQGMSWEKVPYVDGNGKPNVKMDWVPKNN